MTHQAASRRLWNRHNCGDSALVTSGNSGVIVTFDRSRAVRLPGFSQDLCSLMLNLLRALSSPTYFARKYNNNWTLFTAFFPSMLVFSRNYTSSQGCLQIWNWRQQTSIDPYFVTSAQNIFWNKLFATRVSIAFSPRTTDQTSQFPHMWRECTMIPLSWRQLQGHAYITHSKSFSDDESVLLPILVSTERPTWSKVMPPSGESSITTAAKTHVLMCKHSERICKRQKVNNVWQPASNKQFSYYTIITWAPSCLGCKPISELGMLLLAKKERFQYKKPKSPPT